MIRGVIFDFGNVICSFDAGIFFRALRPYGTRTEEELAEAIYRSGLPWKYESGEISSRGFFEGVCRTASLSVPEDRFVEAFSSIFSPIEETLSLIRDLRGKYRLGLLSNTNEWHFEHYIRKVGVFPLFDAVTLSYRVREMKPGEGIYRDALARIGLPPSECVFIDDLPENVDGAVRIGMHGIRYEGPDRLIPSLSALGVIPG